MNSEEKYLQLLRDKEVEITKLSIELVLAYRKIEALENSMMMYLDKDCDK